jgi:hypothetical protein
MVPVSAAVAADRPAVAPPASVATPAPPTHSADLAAIDKALGVQPPVAKPAPAADAAPPRTKSIADSKAPAPAAPPAAPAKQAAPSTTMSHGTPPASPPARAERPAAAPAPAAPVVVPPAAKTLVDIPIKTLVDIPIVEAAPAAEPPSAVAHGTSTASDQAALRAMFEDVAVPYVAEVRGAMMELQWGQVQASWLEMARPVLRSLRKMAEPVGHTALVEALDRFDAALAEVLAPGQPPTPAGPARDALLAAYAPLRASLPRAFELEGERDRREPLIVRALLEQVPGLEPLMLDKMLAAGFGKLSALYAARADEIAAVTGIPDTGAAATAARIQAFRRATPAGLAAVDLGATVRELSRLVGELRAQHTAYEELSRGWTEKDRTAKGQARRERQRSLLQIVIEIVRLGEVDLVQRLDKLPFRKKIDEIEQLIGRAAQAAKATHRPEPPAAGAVAAAT